MKWLQAKESRQPLEAEKGKETDSPREPLEGVMSSDTLILALWDFWHLTLLDAKFMAICYSSNGKLL